MRIWKSVDRWGPGFVSVITLVALIALSWIYSSRLSYQQGEIDTLKDEREKNWQAIETYRLEVQALRVEIARAGVTVKPKKED